MNERIDALLRERFGKDSLIALATAEGGIPSVRAVDALYDNGAFYCVTYLLSNKMKQISKNDTVGLCGEWFTGHGWAQSLGWVRAEENAVLAGKLRSAFAAWYDNGHVNEADENTIILKITLIDGVIMSHGDRIEF